MSGQDARDNGYEWLGAAAERSDSAAMLRLRRAVEAYDATPAELPVKPQAAYAVVDAARTALAADGSQEQ